MLWFPETLKGGAKAKAIESLVSHGLISQKKRETVVTKAGYEALGLKPPVVEPRTVRTRETSKQATVINMLKRTEGATIDQICEATGWQPHYADVLVMPTNVGNPACVAEIAALGSA